MLISISKKSIGRNVSKILNFLLSTDGLIEKLR